MKNLVERTVSHIPISRPENSDITPNQGGGAEPPKYNPTAGWDKPDDNSSLWRQQINQILTELKF